MDRLDGGGRQPSSRQESQDLLRGAHRAYPAIGKLISQFTVHRITASHEHHRASSSAASGIAMTTVPHHGSCYRGGVLGYRPPSSWVRNK